MRRTEFLALTGLTVGNYQNLLQRDAMPLAEDASDGKWRDYGSKDVVLTALALELARVGLDQVEASSVVVVDHGDVGKWLGMTVGQIEDEALGLPDIFYHVARIHWAGDDGTVISKAIGFACPLSHIEKARVQVAAGQSRLFGELAKSVDQIVSVNLTGIMRSIRRRADAAMISYEAFALELLPAPPESAETPAPAELMTRGVKRP